MKYFTTCTTLDELKKGLDICVTICIIGIAVTQK